MTADAPASGKAARRTRLAWSLPRPFDLATLGDGWALPIGSVLALLLVLEVTGLIAFAVGPREPFAGDWMELVYSGRFNEVLSIWQRWDALWYQHIAETGYGVEAIVFFPLYPLLVGLASLLVVGNTVLAGLIVSVVATIVAFYLAIRLLAFELERGGARLDEAAEVGGGAPARRFAPVLAGAVILLFPTGFFLIAPFTESLFLALCLASFYLAARGRSWAAGAVGFLASLTRIPGVFLAPALMFETLRQRGTIDWLLRRGGRPPSLEILAGSLPAIGALALIAYQSLVIGAGTVGLDARAAWGYHVVPPWQALSDSWQFITTGRGAQVQIEMLNLASLVGVSVIAIVGARRLSLSYWLYAWPSIGVLLTRGMYLTPQMSTARLVLVIFPCFFVLAVWLAPHPRLAIAWLAISFLFQLALFQYFVRWGFVG